MLFRSAGLDESVRHETSNPTAPGCRKQAFQGFFVDAFLFAGFDDAVLDLFGEHAVSENCEYGESLLDENEVKNGFSKG